MKTFPNIASVPTGARRAVRDPVALLIEAELEKLAVSEGVEIDLNPRETEDVELRFDGVVARGECRDIALVRLASALLENERFIYPLVRGLGARLSAFGFGESMARS